MFEMACFIARSLNQNHADEIPGPKLKIRRPLIVAERDSPDKNHFETLA
jgi:hypothetical protein